MDVVAVTKNAQKCENVYIRICCILKAVGIDKILKKESYIINKEDLYADIQNGRQKRW